MLLTFVKTKEDSHLWTRRIYPEIDYSDSKGELHELFIASVQYDDVIFSLFQIIAWILDVFVFNADIFSHLFATWF